MQYCKLSIIIYIWLKSSIMKNLYTLLIFFIVSLSYAQNPADRDPTFNTFQQSINQFHNEDEILSTKFQSDGKLLILTAKKLVRRVGNEFDPGFNVTFSGGTGILSDFDIQSDGKILVAGNFSQCNGETEGYLVRLNADGSRDLTFAGSGFSAAPDQVQVCTDGKILVSGIFNSYNSSSANGFVRLNPDGSQDTGFFNGEIFLLSVMHNIYLQPNGKILLASRNQSNYLWEIRLLNSNGLVDSGFATGILNNGNIYASTTQTDGKIIIGGDFSTYNSVSYSGILRLNTDGTVDNTFVVPVGFAATVKCITLQPDGKIFLGCYFVNFDNTSCRGILRLNTDGSKDSSFNTTVGFDVLTDSEAMVRSIAVQPDGMIIVAGHLHYFDNFPINHITRLDSNGNRDTTYTNITKGFDNQVESSEQQSDGKTLVSGKFGSYNGMPTKYLSRLNSDGSLDNSFNFADQGFTFNLPYNTQNSANIKTIVAQADGKIIIGGDFTGNGSSTSSCIARLNSDGTLDNGFFAGTGFAGGSVQKILLQPDGKIIVSGDFTSYNTVACEKIIRLNTNGTRDMTLASVFNSNSYDIALQPDGKILVGGSNIMLRLNPNGSLDTTFSFTLAANSVEKIRLQSDGKIMILAGQTIFPYDSLKRLNADGTLDASFNYPAPGIFHGAWDFLILPDEKILLISYAFLMSNGFERLNSDGTIDSSFNIGIGFNDSISSVTLSQDGKILLGGIFTTYHGLIENRIVRLTGGEGYLIQGHNKLDINNNGCDPGDIDFPNLSLQVSSNASDYTYITNVSGDFNIGLLAGSYTLTPSLENPSYFSVSPTSVSVDFPLQTSPSLHDFCIMPVGNHSDLEVSILPLNVARPGIDSNYKIVYKNKGNQPQSGAVTLTFDDAVTDLVSANPNADVQITNNLSWNFLNLLPFETREITLKLNLNSPIETPPLTSASVLAYTVTIGTPSTDETPEDNTFVLHQNVLNAVDPNDKTCLEGQTINVDKVGDYVHYMIRFENTGTYNAQNISVKDVIDISKFDISTLAPIIASGLFVTRITEGNKVEFYFKDINLPFDDATNDGYVAFKIKTKTTLVAGDTFSNGAAIYFDYNSPVITNTAITAISALAVKDFAFDNFITLYPNPANDELHIAKKQTIEITSIAVYNALGQLVIGIPNAQKTSIVDVSILKSGNYFVQIVSDKGTSNTKFIKL